MTSDKNWSPHNCSYEAISVIFPIKWFLENYKVGLRIYSNLKQQINSCILMSIMIKLVISQRIVKVKDATNALTKP